MSKAADRIPELVSPIMDELKLELWSYEYVKEGRDWYLRVYIDKPDKDEYISTDDCEKVSRFLSEELDREDLFPDKYYLEVSSPGLERELKTDSHFKKYEGEDVVVRLFSPLNGKKEIEGILLRKEGKDIRLKVEDSEMLIKGEMISKVNLAFRI